MNRRSSNSAVPEEVQSPDDNSKDRTKVKKRGSKSVTPTSRQRKLSEKEFNTPPSAPPKKIDMKKGKRSTTRKHVLNFFNFIRPRTYMVDVEENIDDGPVKEELPVEKKKKRKPKIKEEETEKSVDEKVVVAPRDVRGALVKNFCARGAKAILKDFSKFKVQAKEGHTLDAFNSHHSKNRYDDVWLSDEYRVVLKNRENDYIHASYVSMINEKTPKYICCQGPVNETVEDFWAMCYQENAGTIVMLCELVEAGSEKCAAYWPKEKGTATYGQYKVTSGEVQVHEIPGCFLTAIKVEKKDSPAVELTHIFYKEWPDHLCPNNPNDVAELLNLNNLKANGRISVVHCSAGIGRTGTFVFIDMINTYFKTFTVSDVTDKAIARQVKKLRSQRAQAIQTGCQYLWLHVCLMDIVIKENVIQNDESTDNFRNEVQKFQTKMMKKWNEKRQGK